MRRGTDSGWLAAVLAAPDRRDVLLVVPLLILTGLFAWWGVRDKSATFDEPVHVLAGHAAWTLNDYRLNPENGILPCRVAALPLQFTGGVPPIDTDSRDWEFGNKWQVSRDWWYYSGADHERLLRLSRLSMLVFNLGGLATVFLLSAHLWGRGGGYLSLLLVGFSPNFLGHLPLATSDFAGAWTLVLAAVAIAALMEKPGGLRLAAAGGAAALAVLSKHTGVLIAPVAAILLVWRVVDTGPMVAFGKPVRDAWRTRLGWLTGAAMGAALCSLILIWAGYGFRYAAAHPEAGRFVQFQAPWSELKASLPGFLGSLLSHLPLLPESFLYGLAFILTLSERGSFLNGSFSAEGFFLYHFWTYLYKTPIPAMLLHLAGLGGFVQYLLWGKGAWKQPVIRAILVLGLVYGGVLLNSHLSIGHRHAFPMLFLAIVVSGIVVRRAAQRGPGMCGAAMLAALSLIPLAAWNQDRYIAYMNPIGGGKEAGYRRLLDSSLDWGQDLPAAARSIAAYQAGNPGQPVYLSYFGTAEPSAYGVRDIGYLHGLSTWERKAFVPILQPGLYVISASELRHPPESWRLESELAYQSAQLQAVELYAKLEAAGGYETEIAQSVLTEAEYEALVAFEWFRARSLKTSLFPRQPDEVVNGTILLFELSAEELEEAVRSLEPGIIAP